MWSVFGKASGFIDYQSHVMNSVSWRYAVLVKFFVRKRKAEVGGLLLQDSDEVFICLAFYDQ